MKKILILILFFTSLLSFGQTSVSIVFTPQDWGGGLRIDHQIEDYGIYSSLTYGNYEYKPLAYVRDHYRLTVGGMKYINLSYVGTGVCLNRYGKYCFANGEVNRALIPVSIEVCAGTRLGRFTVGLAVDLLKYDIGINFGYLIKK